MILTIYLGLKNTDELHTFMAEFGLIVTLGPDLESDLHSPTYTSIPTELEKHNPTYTTLHSQPDQH